MTTTAQLSPDVQQRVRATGVSLSRVERVIRDAVAEDLDGGTDVTSIATVSDRHRSTMDIVARGAGTVCGLAFAEAVFAICDPSTTTLYRARDGEAVSAGTVLLSVTGSTRGLLLAERTALNLLGHLSGIATATAQWVHALEGTRAKVRDTRKTLPNLRALQKYAVRCGGGTNHRIGLFDAMLVKDNHVAGLAPKEMAERIVSSGDKVEDYIDIKLSVSESRYTNWPTALQEQFAAARTVEEGKPTITLTLDGGAA